MMTGITIAKDTRLFLLSLAVGAGMSFLYDLLRVLRRRTAHRAAAVSLEDILYFLLCALLHFAFVLKDNRGQLRGYILVGELLGWVCWHLSAGAVLVEAGSRLLGIVQRVVAGILRVPHLSELNIGFSIISRAVFVGLGEAVKEMRKLMDTYTM